ncbi:MAG: hypothetical protein WCL46_03930 [Chlorobium sp.]
MIWVQSNPENMVKAAVGVAGGAALIAPAAPVFAPVAMPALHGLAGIAVVGLGIFAVGSLVVKTAGALSSIGNLMTPKGDGKAVG